MTGPHLFWIPPGDAGTYWTLDAMAALARQASRDPLTIFTVGAILRPSDIMRRPPPSDSWGTARQLREWLADRFAFLADPVGAGVFGHPDQDIELVRDPVILLREIQQTAQAHGDCDDAATLAAALTTAAGLPTRFRVVGFVPGGPFTHVYAEARTTHGWVDFDVTRPGVVPDVQRTDVVRV